MRIAAVSDDGNTISQHFGRAPLYVVLTVEDGKIVGRETRPKAGHHTFVAGGGHQHHGCGAGQRHGYDAGAQDRHSQMAGSITDCQVLLAGGLGWGAYENLKGRGIEPIVTDVLDANEAAQLYLEGRLPNLMERLH